MTESPHSSLRRLSDGRRQRLRRARAGALASDPHPGGGTLAAIDTDVRGSWAMRGFWWMVQQDGVDRAQGGPRGTVSASSVPSHGSASHLLDRCHMGVDRHACCTYQTTWLQRRREDGRHRQVLGRTAPWRRSGCLLLCEQGGCERATGAELAAEAVEDQRREGEQGARTNGIGCAVWNVPGPHGIKSWTIASACSTRMKKTC
jgi:hypothetical protein